MAWDQPAARRLRTAAIAGTKTRHESRPNIRTCRDEVRRDGTAHVDRARQGGRPGPHGRADRCKRSRRLCTAGPRPTLNAERGRLALAAARIPADLRGRSGSTVTPSMPRRKRDLSGILASRASPLACKESHLDAWTGCGIVSVTADRRPPARTASSASPCGCAIASSSRPAGTAPWSWRGAE